MRSSADEMLRPIRREVNQSEGEHTPPRSRGATVFANRFLPFGFNPVVILDGTRYAHRRPLLGGGNCPMIRRSPKYLILVLSLILSIPAVARQNSTSGSFNDVAAYIDKAWDTLSRSMDKCETVLDKRVPEHSVLYLPSDFEETDAIKELGTRCKLAIQHLPEKITS